MEGKLSSISSDPAELQKMLEKVVLLKKANVDKGEETIAKILWCYQTIINIHILYVNIFNLFNKREFYESWCELSKLEIILFSLKRHFNYSDNQHRLLFIEKATKNLQSLFPYKIFASHESIYREKICSICSQIVNIRKPCGHIVGEIYKGEMCYRIVTKADLLAISFVENPVNKYAVAFLKMDSESEFVDHYNYEVLEGFLSYISSPDDEWDLEIIISLKPHELFKDIGVQDYCPCGSAKRYKDCCLHNDGVKHVHYSIVAFK